MAQPRPGARGLHPVSEAAVRDLADGMERLQHSFHRARSQMLAKARQDVEWSSIVIISVLVRSGPMRAGALADIVQSDPSTISRQVAGLVRDGYVERQDDPEDGRATVLAATAKARTKVAEHKRFRNAHYQRMLAGWTDSERAQFAALVAKFNSDFEKYRTTLDAYEWLESPDDVESTEEATP